MALRKIDAWLVNPISHEREQGFVKLVPSYATELAKDITSAVELVETQQRMIEEQHAENVELREWHTKHSREITELLARNARQFDLIISQDRLNEEIRELKAEREEMFSEIEFLHILAEDRLAALGEV